MYPAQVRSSPPCVSLCLRLLSVCRTFLNPFEMPDDRLDACGRGLLTESFTRPPERIAPDGHLRAAVRLHVAAVDDPPHALGWEHTSIAHGKRRQAGGNTTDTIGHRARTTSVSAMTRRAVRSEQRGAGFGGTAGAGG